MGRVEGWGARVEGQEKNTLEDVTVLASLGPTPWAQLVLQLSILIALYIMSDITCIFGCNIVCINDVE